MSFIDENVFILATAIVGVMVIIGRIKIGGNKSSHQINRSWIWQRFGTIFALGLGVLGACVPATFPAAEGVVHRLMLGIIAATMAVTCRSALKDNLFKFLENKR